MGCRVRQGAVVDKYCAAQELELYPYRMGSKAILATVSVDEELFSSAIWAANQPLESVPTLGGEFDVFEESGDLDELFDEGLGKLRGLHQPLLRGEGLAWQQGWRSYAGAERGGPLESQCLRVVRAVSLRTSR